MNIVIPVLASVVGIALHVILAKLLPSIVKGKDNMLGNIKNVLVNDNKDIIVTSIVTGIIIFSAVLIADNTKQHVHRASD